MFEKGYVENSKFVKIPPTLGKEELFVSDDGQVFSIEKGEIPIHTDSTGHLVVHADLWDGLGDYRLDLLILIAHGRLRLPTKFLHYVDTFRLDGNPDNYHPNNIGYRYKEPIECDEYPGFYYIPFFNLYVINREGIVLEWVSGDRVKSYAVFNKGRVKGVTGGYHQFSLESDVGKFGIGRHRLLCLTFKPYPDHVDKLDVNHLDGIPGNDWLDNLEWSTRSRNIVHAYENGLRSQNFVLYAKNVFTGEERQFYSAQEAKRQINGDVHAILRRVNDGSQKLYTGGWLFKSDPSEPWREVQDPHKELNALSNSTKCLSKNVFTGEVREHESASRIGIDLGFEKHQTPRSYLNKGLTRPYFGYTFKFASDPTPWPEYSERELAVFRDNPKSNGRGVIARNAEGEELFFTNSEKAALHFQHTLKKHTDVMKAIARGRVVDGYRFTYL